jgi:dinuclear metal center YbgI/SA1388 family protein
MRLNTIVRFLNKELKVRSIPDASRNGLQVRASSEVKMIGFAVDACMETFEKAVARKCDLLVVHHGLFWKGQGDESGQRKKRTAFLKRKRLSLYAAHLPLDRHEQHGNNAKLSEMIGLTHRKRFGKYKGNYIGYKGKLRKSTTRDALVRSLNRKLKTKCAVIPFGPGRIRTIGVVSGGGVSLRQQAVKEKLDCFVTGDSGHDFYHVAKEGRLNVVMAGHYATETLGVKALMLLLKEKFNIQTAFIDTPTGM